MVIEHPHLAFMLVTPDQQANITVFYIQVSEDLSSQSMRREDYVFKLYLTDEWNALNDLVHELDESFCQIFVNGLTSDTMKQRLIRHVYSYDHSPVSYSALLTCLYHNKVEDFATFHYPYTTNINELIYQFIHNFIVFTNISNNCELNVNSLVKELTVLKTVINDEKTLSIIDHYLNGINV